MSAIMPDWATKVLVGAGFGAAVALGISVFGVRGSDEPRIELRVAEQAEELRVTEEELEIYIDVYRAMQADRSLKIDDVLADRGVSLAEFRNIERRVQMQGRLIKRVREALLEQAKENAALLAERGVSAIH